MDIVEYNPANSIRHPWELVRLAFVTRLIRKYKKQNAKILILDIGCGDCFFSLSLLDKKLPATIIGIDPTYSAEDLVAKRKTITYPDFHLFNNIDEARQMIKEPVDMVLLLDVIEHIPDDISFLKGLAGQDFINADTTFVITVPAYQSLFTSHDEFLLHYRRYNNSSLKQHLRSGGLEPVETGYFFFSLLPVRMFQKMKEKLVGKSRQQKGLGGWTHGKFITGIAKGILSMDVVVSRFNKKIGINVPGLSNYSICKKHV